MSLSEFSLGIRVALLMSIGAMGVSSRYGEHSQLQIAAGLFCSLVLATWASAEVPCLFVAAGWVRESDFESPSWVRPSCVRN